MKVLMISTDRKLFDKTSKVFGRIFDYSKGFEELHVIVFNKGKQENFSVGNLHIYSTNSKTKLFYIKDAVRVGKKIKDINFITTQDPFETGLVGYLLRKGKRFNIQIHTDIFSKHFKHTFLNKIRIIIAKFLIKRADSVRVVSERIKKSVSYLTNKEIKVLPIFSDTTKKVSEKNNNVIKILTVGRLEKEKNIKTIIKALSKVKENFVFDIVGSGSQEYGLKNLVNRLGIQDKVSFHGHIDNLDDIYSRADIYIHASLYEGFGLSLLEAASHGLPIITTNVGLIDHEINKESVIVFEPYDVNGLTRKITQLINHKELREELGKLVKLDTQKFSDTYENYLLNYKNSI